MEEHHSARPLSENLRRLINDSFKLRRKRNKDIEMLTEATDQVLSMLPSNSLDPASIGPESWKRFSSVGAYLKDFERQILSSLSD